VVSSHCMVLFWSWKMNKRNQATVFHFLIDFYSFKYSITQILISLLSKDLLLFFLQIISPAFVKILSQETLVAGMQIYFLTRTYKWEKLTALSSKLGDHEFWAKTQHWGIFHFYCGISCSIVYHRSGFHRYD